MYGQLGRREPTRTGWSGLNSSGCGPSYGRDGCKSTECNSRDKGAQLPGARDHAYIMRWLKEISKFGGRIPQTSDQHSTREASGTCYSTASRSYPSSSCPLRGRSGCKHAFQAFKKVKV